MKALKALVVAMAALIVAALTVVVVTLVQRAGDIAPGDPAARMQRPAAPSAPIAGLPGPGFGETSVALPPGAEIVETRTGGGRIVLRIREATGAAALVVIDAATGRRLGLVRLEAGGATGGAGGGTAPR